MGGAAFLSKFISPDKVYVLLVSASAITVLFAWIGICMSHYKFRQFLEKKGGVGVLKFKAPFFPVGPIVAGVLCVVVIIAQFFDPTARLTAVLGVPMFFILWAVGKYKEKKGTLWVPSEEAIRAQSTSTSGKEETAAAGQPGYVE
jgi:lysine-specific permease